MGGGCGLWWVVEVGGDWSWRWWCWNVVVGDSGEWWWCWVLFQGGDCVWLVVLVSGGSG